MILLSTSYRFYPFVVLIEWLRIWKWLHIMTWIAGHSAGLTRQLTHIDVRSAFWFLNHDDMLHYVWRGAQRCAILFFSYVCKAWVCWLPFLRKNDWSVLFVVLYSIFMKMFCNATFPAIIVWFPIFTLKVP